MQHVGLTVPDGDLLIHSGDALGRGTYEEAVRFNAWLGLLPHKHKIYVPGNHDEIFEENPAEGRAVMTNAIVLIDESVEVDGLKIYGSPWTKQYYDWSFMKRDEDLKDLWDRIPRNLDILITHGPPYGILDWNMNGIFCGSQKLQDAVMQKAPKFHVFGHIHHASGVVKTEHTTFINAAVLNDYYHNVNTPKEFQVTPL